MVSRVCEGTIPSHYLDFSSTDFNITYFNIQTHLDVIDTEAGPSQGIIEILSQKHYIIS